MKLPKVVFIKIRQDQDGTTYLQAGRNLEEVEPDELNRPELIGTYVLQDIRQVVKQVHMVKKEK